MKTNTTDETAAKEVAAYFRQAIQTPVFWALGADPKSLGYAINPDPYQGALRFTAKILPFLKDGSRGTRPRRMQVEVSLTWADLIDIQVTYCDRNYNVTKHAECRGLFIDQLNNALLALDWDGPEAFNPRYL